MKFSWNILKGGLACILILILLLIINLNLVVYKWYFPKLQWCWKLWYLFASRLVFSSAFGAVPLDASVFASAGLSRRARSCGQSDWKWSGLECKQDDACRVFVIETNCFRIRSVLYLFCEIQLISPATQRRIRVVTSFACPTFARIRSSAGAIRATGGGWRMDGWVAKWIVSMGHGIWRNLVLIDL